MTLDLMSDGHVTGYVAIFWRENKKNYNLLLAKRKIVIKYITQEVFVVKMSIRDVTFAVP